MMPDKLHVATNNIDISAKVRKRKGVIAIFLFSLLGNEQSRDGREQLWFFRIIKTWSSRWDFLLARKRTVKCSRETQNIYSIHH